MAKRIPHPKNAVYPEHIVEEALDRGMHPADLVHELQEVRLAGERMAAIDAKKLAEMQAGRDEPASA